MVGRKADFRSQNSQELPLPSILSRGAVYLEEIGLENYTELESSNIIIILFIRPSSRQDLDGEVACSLMP